MKRRIPTENLDIGKDTAEGILHALDGLSCAVILPGLWGAEEIVAHLTAEADVLRVDGALNDNSSGSPIRAALRAASSRWEAEELWISGTDHGKTEEGLHRWARAHRSAAAKSGLPVVLLESSHLLDSVSAEMLARSVVSRRLRVVVFLSLAERMPEFLSSLHRTGWLDVLHQPPMTIRELDLALRRRLRSQVSATVLHRVTDLCAGHAVLAQRVLDVAIASGVLHREEGLWVWCADESHFQQELAQLSAELVGSFTPGERELLILSAISRSVPAAWAAERYGSAVVNSLRTQQVLGMDASGPRGSRDLHINAEALRLMLLSDIRGSESIRQWYSIGRQIPSEAGGPASRAALTWWRARVEGNIEPSAAESAARFGIARAWYALVLDVVASVSEESAPLQVLAARAHEGRGDIHAALEVLQRLSERASGENSGPSGELDSVVVRDAVMITERIALFHPEEASAVLTGLRRRSPASVTPHLDQLRKAGKDIDVYDAAELVARVRRVADPQESIVVQLWIGVFFGLRRHPDFGRLVLSSLLDDLTREGGQPDVEEHTVALLLLITTVHGWRTDTLRVNFKIWNGRAVRGPALPGVADVVTATMAMQQDRMRVAFEYASSAVRTFSVHDPFGLLPMASALAAATSSYVDEDLTRSTHRDHWQRIGTGTVRYGLKPLRLVAEGMALVGSGPPTHVVRNQLVKLGAEARKRGEWAQEQQLLLLGVLGGSAEAVEAVLSSQWHQEPGRSRMIGLLAQAVAADSVEQAIDIAELLIDSDATFFGLSVLALQWRQGEGLDRATRSRIVRSVLAVKRRGGGDSWLLGSFAELILSERDTKVMRGLHTGRSVRDIAASLHLSPRTVEATISNMLRRFSCRNRVELLDLDLLRD